MKKGILIFDATDSSYLTSINKDGCNWVEEGGKYLAMRLQDIKQAKALVKFIKAEYNYNESEIDYKEC
ncbi:MAG: hypothetical protein ACTSQE_17205 [Candidatus Heimdallarchaeaceae archaeon]